MQESPPSDREDPRPLPPLPEDAPQRVLQLDRILRALRDVHQVLMGEKDLQRLLDRTCAALLDSQTRRGAWIAVRGGDDRPVSWAQAGFDASFEGMERRFARGLWPACRSQTVTAPSGIVVTGLLDDCRECPLAPTVGRSPAALLQLRRHGRDLGMLGVSLPESAVLGAEEQALLVGVAGDLAHAIHGLAEEKERFRAEAALRATFAETRRRERETRALLAAARAAQELDTFADVARAIFAWCCQATGASTGHLVALDPEGRPGAVLVRETGAPAPISDRMLPEPIRRLRQQACAERRAMFENDCGQPSDLTPGHVQPQNVLMAPLVVDDVAVGVLGIGDKPGGFTVEDTSVAQAFADLAAQALRRIRSEQALQDERNLFRDLVDAMPAGVYRLRVRPAGTWKDETWVEDVRSLYSLELVSDRFCQILGASREACLANATVVPDQVHPDDKPGFISANVEATSRVTPFAWEGRLLRNGTPVWVRFASMPRRMDDGDVIWTGILVDRSAERRAEEEHERLQTQLFQAQKMESVGRLAGGVAHDFNNLLGVILGRVEMALEEADGTGAVRGDLMEIQGAAQRSAALTRQLLAFARKQTVMPRVVQLDELVEGLLRMLQRLMGENIELAWHPGEGTWPVRIDPSHLDQVLANLCVNARDAIQGVGRVTIATRNVVVPPLAGEPWEGVGPGRYVVLTVQDDGQGMPPEVLEHLFEPFFTTKKRGVGTGLGLATVHGIVLQNGGFIKVASRPGEGATFQILFPASGESCPASQGLGTPSVPRSRGERVLLVEDESALLSLVTRLLENLGYEVQAASRPTEAIQRVQARERPFDLLVTDVIMPEMDCFALAERLRHLQPGLRCLFLSGYTADVLENRDPDRDGFTFLQKPFTRATLAEKVRQVLDGA